MAINNDDVDYNVVCTDCGHVFQPAIGSPMWWQAKKRSTQGFLDALPVSGDKCGCIKKQTTKHHHPFCIFGYNDMFENFSIPCRSFVEAVKKYIELKRECTVEVSIHGVSRAVLQRLWSM